MRHDQAGLLASPTPIAFPILWWVTYW